MYTGRILQEESILWFLDQSFEIIRSEGWPNENLSGLLVAMVPNSSTSPIETDRTDYFITGKTNSYHTDSYREQAGYDLSIPTQKVPEHSRYGFFMARNILANQGIPATGFLAVKGGGYRILTDSCLDLKESILIP